MQKLDAKSLALALGLTWGCCILFGGLAAMFGWAVKFVNVMGSFYVGYKASVPGAVIGGIWGFFDAGIGGLIIAWLYNAFAKA